MSGSYTVEPVTGMEIAQALPLLYGLAPDASLERWRAFCEGRAAAARGQMILAARNAVGYLQGFCAYGRIEHLRHGPIIDAHTFLVASVADPGGVADELLAALEAACVRDGCAGVLVGLNGLGHDLRSRIAGRGRISSEDAVLLIAETGR
jgi:hypothetical protein